MRAVNLLPRETSSRKFSFNGELAAAIAFTVLIAVAVVGGFVLQRSHASAAKTSLAATQAALDRAQSQPKATQARLQIPEVVSQAQPWHLALDTALSTRVAWDVFLSQLEYVVPDRVVVTTVSFGSADAATSGATSSTVTLSGNAYSLHDVAVFMSTLGRVPKISQVNLVSSAANVGTNITTFQITAQVTLPAAPVAPPAPTATTTTPGGTA